MKFVLVKPDNVVCVDGVCQQGVDLSSLPADVHAIQWFGDHGEIEFVDATKQHARIEHFTDMSPYTKYLNEYTVKKAAYEAERL